MVTRWLPNPVRCKAKQVPLTRPAEEPGTPLEPSGNRRPREMVTHDRIRLTGLLRKSPALQGFSMSEDDAVHHGGITNREPVPATDPHQWP